MIGRLKALLAGFALGVFLAPRSGRESRRLLREKIEELLDLREAGYERLEEEIAERRRGHAAEWPEEPPSGAAPIPDAPPEPDVPPPEDAPFEDEPEK